MKTLNDIKTIAVAGAGTMGTSLAETFAKFSYNVIIYDVAEEALNKAGELMKIHQITEVSEKIVTEEESKALLSRISYTNNIRDLAAADFAVECIVEKMDIKKAFWSQLSDIVAEDAVLVTNTSGLSITELAEAVGNPERFGGMHWINPPHIIPLVEVIKGEKTASKTAETVYALCERVGKKPVIVKDAPGFVLNRIQFAVLRECLHIAEQGIASPEDIDKVMKYALGLRYACLGPFEIADHGGLDIFYNISEYLFEDLSSAEKSFYTLKELAESGNYGVKTGKGFYDYSDGKDKEAIIYRDAMYTKVAKCLYGE